MNDPTYRFDNDVGLDAFLKRNKLIRHEAQILPAEMPKDYPTDSADGKSMPIAYALIGGGIRIPHEGEPEIRIYRNKLIQDLEDDPGAKTVSH